MPFHPQPSRFITMVEMIGLVGMALATAARPAFAQNCSQPSNSNGLVDMGAMWINTVSTEIQAPWKSGCPTTIVRFQTSGETSDFAIANGPAPGCVGFTWTSANLNRDCNITIYFKPTATGTYSEVITPVVSNGVGVGSLTAQGAGFTITASSVETPQIFLDNFALALPEPQSATTPSDGYGSLTFDSGQAAVSWTPTLQYQTSGGLPNPPAQPAPAPTPFSTANGPFTLGFGSPIPGASPPPSVSFPIAGGFFNLDAETDIGADYDPTTLQFPAWITGVPYQICTATITNQLESLYSSSLFSAESAACTATGAPFSCCTAAGAGACGPATPNLLALIAWKESSYQQFHTARNVNHLKIGAWPFENQRGKPKGAYIGLMQDAFLPPLNTYASPMDTAWSWQINAQIGQEIFQQKIGYVVQAAQDAVAEYPTLASLSQTQLESMALYQYGGWLPRTKTPTDFSAQYYTPELYDGSWQWRPNTKISAHARLYVNSVFKPRYPLPTLNTCN